MTSVVVNKPHKHAHIPCDRHPGLVVIFVPAGHTEWTSPSLSLHYLPSISLCPGLKVYSDRFPMSQPHPLFVLPYQPSSQRSTISPFKLSLEYVRKDILFVRGAKRSPCVHHWTSGWMKSERVWHIVWPYLINNGKESKNFENVLFCVCQVI